MSQSMESTPGKRTSTVWLGLCAGFIVLALIVLLSLQGLTQPLATVLLGSLALVVALWRSLIAEKQAEAAQKQAETAAKQALTAEQGQVTDRFTRAIEQLGDEKGRIAVRLGGIYALERIAEDSERDFLTVMTVLCAYVREKVYGQEENNKLLVSADTQAILTVLSRCRPERNRHHVDLSGAFLVGKDLSAMNFAGANFSRADLRHANLRRANLSQVYEYDYDPDDGSPILVGWYACGADLSKANLLGAELFGADLSEAKNLTQPQVDSARGDGKTELPDDLKAPDSWIAQSDG